VQAAKRIDLDNVRVAFMKICMLAPEFLPVWGGVGTYIVELVRHLPKDIEVHVVTPIREGFGEKKVSTSDYDFSRYFGSNIHIHFVCRASDTFFYNAKFQYACLKYVPKLVKEEQIDLIHSHTAHMPDLLLMFRKLSKPIITTVHTTIKLQRLGTMISNRKLHEWERSEKLTYLTYPALRLAEEMYFRRKRLYITSSYWMKNWLENNFHVNKVKVIPNSVDIDNTKHYATISNLIPEGLRNKQIVLYVGRLLAMKGVDTFIEAIPEILNRIEKGELLFMFAGPGDRARYIRKVKQMKIESCCLFAGPLPREDIIHLMSIAEVVVVPSFIENTPYVVLESMACGVPVIATKVGGIPEIIEDKYNGLLIEPGSSTALANAVARLLGDRQLRNLLGKRARRTIEKKFSWKVNIPKYIETYFEALNS
jgi:glycosyltransferase involved in cell wall biosynthesis